MTIEELIKIGRHIANTELTSIKENIETEDEYLETYDLIYDI
jgi:hypothetical protein